MNRNEEPLQLVDIEKSFHGAPVLRGVRSKIVPKSIVGLIGPSGGGKSTLLKIMGDVLAADRGEFLRGEIRSSDVSLMFQEGALFDSLSVADNVAFSLLDGNVPLARLSNSARSQAIEEVSWILNRVGLFAAAHKMPAQISGGMRRRVSLARALVCRPILALLDDPTAGLDPVASSVIMDLIVELHRESEQTTIIASHDLRRLLPICDEVIGLFDGKILFQGPVSALCESPEPVRKFIACRFDLSTQEHQSGSAEVPNDG